MLVLKGAPPSAEELLDDVPGWKAPVLAEARDVEGILLAADVSGGEKLRGSPTGFFVAPIAVACTGSGAAEETPPTGAGGAGASHESMDSMTEVETGAPMTKPPGGGTGAVVYAGNIWEALMASGLPDMRAEELGEMEPLKPIDSGAE